jgi:hypothetical protein
MLTETGRAPTPEELAEKLAMPVEKVRRLLEIARAPIKLEMPASAASRWQLGEGQSRITGSCADRPADRDRSFRPIQCAELNNRVLFGPLVMMRALWKVKETASL